MVFEILIRKWRKELDLKPTKKFLRILGGVCEMRCDALGPPWDPKFLPGADPKFPQATYNPVCSLAPQGSKADQSFGPAKNTGQERLGH